MEANEKERRLVFVSISQGEFDEISKTISDFLGKESGVRWERMSRDDLVVIVSAMIMGSIAILRAIAEHGEVDRSCIVARMAHMSMVNWWEKEVLKGKISDLVKEHLSKFGWVRPNTGPNGQGGARIN